MEAIHGAADLEDAKATSKNIIFLSDSQAVLECLPSPNNIDSDSTIASHLVFNELAKSKAVVL